MLNLKSETSNEKIILDYLEKNASEVLREKINNGKKTLKQCWSYITAEAKKLAENGCACVEDAKVFGWAVHFFEEDSIEAKDYYTSASKPKVKAVKTNAAPTPTKKKNSPKNEENPAQLSFFNM